jgi:hypothetical protein
MRRRKVFILGDSHATAIAEAVKLRKESGADADSPVDFFASRFEKTKGNGKTIPGLSMEEALAKLGAADKNDILVSALGGNQYNTLGLLESPEPFDLVDPVTRADPETTRARIVPLAQMSASFNDFVGGVRPPLIALKAKFKGQVFHLNPPPPKADNDYIRKNAEGYFRTDGKVVLNVSPAGMRRRLWLAQTGGLERLCRMMGITFIDAPAEALDAGGFLVREGYGADATHANAFYGELVLRKLEAMTTTANLEVAR